MTITKKTTHVEEALANLIAQFEEQQTLRDLIEIYVNQVQDLENAFDDILQLTDNIDVAFGQQLNNLGQIVGEERFGRTDLQYRTGIKSRILLNTSDGTIEDLIALVLSLQPGLALEFSETFPAGFFINITTPIDPAIVDINQLSTIIKSGRAGGVRGLIQFAVSPAKQFDVAGGGFDEGEFGVVLEAC